MVALILAGGKGTRLQPFTFTIPKPLLPLGDVPVLDWVFANTSSTRTTTELLVFVTPVVVDNPDENDTNFNVGEMERLRALEKPLDSKVQELQRDAGLEEKSQRKVAPSSPEAQPVQPIETPLPNPAAAPAASPSGSKPDGSKPAA